MTTDNDEDDPAVVTIADVPGTDPATLEVKKVDKETGESMQQGDASLAGTQFTVKYYNDYYEDASKLPSTPTKTWVLETKKFGNKINISFEDNYKVSGDAFYKDAAGNVVIPYGTITIEETKAAEGYKLEDSTVSVNGTVLSNRTYFSKVSETDWPSKIVSDFTVSDPSKMYGIQVWKSDKELSKSEAIGGREHTGSADGTTLAGTQFSVINRSASAVHYNDKDIAPGEEVMKLTAKWNDELKKYTAQTEEKALPYGTYGIKEVKSSQGYLLTDGEEKTVVCHGDDGHMYTPEEMEVLNFFNQVIRGNYQFIKRAETTQKYISTAFKLTNKTTGESHVIVTDKNGEFDSAANKHSENTNANDKLLDDYDEKTGIKSSDFDLSAGTWFGKGEDGSMAKANDELGALPYGRYEVEELRTDTNKGMKLVTYEFYITKDGKNVNGGTLDNQDQPKIGTQAKDDETGTNYSYADDEAAIIDTVSYTGLDAGKTYKLVGTLMDKATGKALTDASGKEISVSKEFKPSVANGTTDVEFTFDASKLAGKDVVVFESLYLDTELIAEHKDLDDEGQTIHFPKIGTKAADKETGTNVSCADEDITIVDTVSYKNLKPGKTYEVSGTLMDKETGKPVLDDDGKEIKAAQSFKAETSEGTVDMTFTFKGVKTAGKTIVAFEEVSYQGKTFAVHADINDEDQTIYVPEVKTTAKDKVSESQNALAEGTVTIVDTISYKNLFAGKEYKVSGVLMDQSTGEELLINGEKVTSEAVFTPENTEGTVDVAFTFDASGLNGKTTVVFEKLYQDEKLVGVHADIEDQGQSIYFPEIKTTLKDKETDSQNAMADEKVTLADTIAYENLIAGKEYKVTGVLMDQSTGKELLVGGKTVTAETTFTAEKAEGTVDVTFEFDGSALKGKTVVAFETIYHNDKKVGVHADIKDESQSVYFPEIKTTATDKADGGHTVTAKKKVTITDKVEYSNLIAGREYEVRGTLMDQSTGKALKVNGKEVTASKKFTPEKSSGSVNLDFTFDARKLGGKTTVVFEKLFDTKSKIEVANHEDIKDKGQTVKIKKAPKPTSSESPTPSGGSSPSGTKTGDNILLYAGIAIGAVLIGGAAYVIKKKKFG